MDADCHEEEIEVCEIFDEFPTFGKNVFTKFSGMQPQEERVFAVVMVTINIYQGK